MKKKPVLIVIAGPNGSGKTSVTRTILKHHWIENAVYINPDQVAQEIFGDWNSQESVLKAANYCEDWRNKCIEEGQSLIFETVLSSQGKIDFIEMAIKKGFFVRLFFVCTDSPTINASRIAKRVMEGGHDVPISKIISRYSKSVVNALQISKNIDRAYFFDNSREFKEPILLLKVKNGKVAKTYSKINAWAQPILEVLR